ncbi:MAG: GNAT family N-acetyltransferase [Oscillospiraceae bacterium]|nr:GNAT family N-acetyltransferase [Oscillospiraceae bacterium]
MLETRIVKKGSVEAGKAQKLIDSQFPKSERIPMAFLLARANKNFTDFLTYYDNEEFVGFTYSVTHNDLTFIFYIAIDPAVQSKGYGSMILNQVQAQYPNNRLVLNVEMLDERAENSEQRIRRRAFYAKNGYENAGIITSVHGNTLDTLITGGTTKIEELQTLFKQFTGVYLGIFIKYKLSYTENGGV